MPAPPPNSYFLKSLPGLPIAVLHSLAPVSALKAVTTASVSTTTSRLSATTGAAPSRCVLVLPAMLALQIRSEEHTSELQSLMRISYAVFCLNKKNTSGTIHVQGLTTNNTTVGKEE